MKDQEIYSCPNWDKLKLYCGHMMTFNTKNNFIFWGSYKSVIRASVIIKFVHYCKVAEWASGTKFVAVLAALLYMYLTKVCVNSPPEQIQHWERCAMCCSWTAAHAAAQTWISASLNLFKTRKALLYLISTECTTIELHGQMLQQTYVGVKMKPSDYQNHIYTLIHFKLHQNLLL